MELKDKIFIKLVASCKADKTRNCKCEPEKCKGLITLADEILALIEQEEEADTVARFIKRGWLPPEQARETTCRVTQLEEIVAGMDAYIKKLQDKCRELEKARQEVRKDVEERLFYRTSEQ